MRRIALVVTLALLAGGCTDRPESQGGGEASPSPSVSVTAAPDEWAARLGLAKHFDIFWCDPDVYPVGRPDEARTRGLAWYQVAENSAEAAAIRADLGLTPPLTDEEKLAVYQRHKLIRIITLRPHDAAFAFVLNESVSSGVDRVDGTIAAGGAIRETARRAVENASCPVCLARGTMIATPSGERDVATLRAGDTVWTRDAHGARVAVPVLRVIARPVISPHSMVRLALADGRSVVAAAAHPDATGRALGALRPGDEFDGSVVLRAEAILVHGEATYDLLPAGPSGAYWANGILLGSTIRR